jgi:hypothetical protein|tara:strand:- start:30 stop:302 length:273 start_codon:yes stop_codon:yes gene_type:complete
MLEQILEQIPKEELIEDRWYLGRGRNNNLGYWDGNSFIVIGKTFDNWRIKKEQYYGKDEGCFQPFILIDEGETVEPLVIFNYLKTIMVKN